MILEVSATLDGSATISAVSALSLRGLAGVSGDSDLLAIGLVRPPVQTSKGAPPTTPQRVVFHERAPRYLVNTRPSKPREASIMDRNVGGRPERTR
jgi:hypothetical protein